MPHEITTTRNRKSALSVADTARLCGMSRARFYDLIRDGVMPHPVYCLRTRRPLYTADLAALCVRVRETNTGVDGRYVIFYSRFPTAPTTARSTPSRNAPRPAAPDPLTQEMVESLRTMGVRTDQDELLMAIRRQCPQGVREESFEGDLRAVFDHLRCRNVG